MKFKIIIGLILSLFSSITFFGQEYSIKTDLVHEPLGRKIFHKQFMIDSNNYLWIASDTHLIKKIGDEYIYYDYNHPNLKKLIHKKVIVELNPNKLLVFSGGGVFEFSILDGTINWIYVRSKGDVNHLNSYTRDIAGNIWIATANYSLYCYTKDNEFVVNDLSKFVEQKYKNKKGRHLRVQKGLDNDKILISIKKDLYIYKDDLLKLVFKNSAFKKSQLDYKIKVVENGKLFPKNKSGSFSLEGQTYQFIYVPEIQSHVFKWMHKSISRLVEFKNKALFKQIKKNVFISQTNSKVTLFFLNSNFKIEKVKEFKGFEGIENVFMHNNEIWVNDFSAITSIEIKPKLFKNIYLPKSKINYRRLSAFRSIIDVKSGNLYTIIDFKLYKINKRDTIPRIIKYVKHKDLLQTWLYGLQKDGDSVFFAYGFNNKFFRINHQKEIFEEFEIPNFQKFEVEVKDFEPMGNHQFLIGTTKGLYSFNNKTKKINKFNFKDSSNLENEIINELFFDKISNQLWIGTINNGGLYKKDMNSGEIIHFNSKSKKTKLINDNINCLYLDSNHSNILWIGTEQGLQKLDIKTNSSQYFLKGNSLKSKIVSILKANNSVFVGTYDGMFVIDSKDNMKRYREDDGLPNKEFNKKSLLKLENDSIYLGTINGLTMFNPTTLSHNNAKENKLELIEKSYWDFNKNKFVQKRNNLVNEKVFNISHKKNFLKLKFSVNDLIDAESIEYRYKLGEDKKEWTQLGNYNSIDLISLESGKYDLVVQALNKNAILTNTLNYQLNISKVFYEQWLFKFGVVSLFLLGLCWYFYIKIRSSKQRYKIALLKSHALSTQMNPHFINNVLNGIQSKIIMNDELTANRYIKSFSKLCKHTLSINTSQFLTLAEEVSYLKEYVQITQIKLGNLLQFSIVVEDSIEVNKMYIPTMILQPIVENAIEHGLVKKEGDKVLKIHFYIKDKKLYIEIKDNGIGRKMASINQRKRNKDDFKRPHALEILKKRKEMLNSMYKINFNYSYKNIDDYNVNTGTKVIVNLDLCTTNFSGI